jgi:putative phage-type endonuclease
MEQGTAEWHAERLGKVTASKVADVIAKTKTGYSASRVNYMADLLIERLTGQPTERFTNAAMQWGTDNEPAARDMYAFDSEAVVDTVGFVPHPTIAMTGASPDGLVGDDGLVEIKCPNTATHLDTLLTDRVPEKYQIQMLWQMACTGRAWCDFVSFDPRLPAAMRLFVRRFHRDDARIAELEAEVVKFLAELDAQIAALQAKGYGITPTFTGEELEAAQ